MMRYSKSYDPDQEMHMKCVEMTDGRKFKVTNEEAQHLVHTSKAKYITEDNWKEAQR